MSQHWLCARRLVAILQATRLSEWPRPEMVASTREGLRERVRYVPMAMTVRGRRCYLVWDCRRRAPIARARTWHGVAAEARKLNRAAA